MLFPARFFLITVAVIVGGTILVGAIFGLAAATAVIPYLGVAGIAIALADRSR